MAEHAVLKVLFLEILSVCFTTAQRLLAASDGGSERAGDRRKPAGEQQPQGVLPAKPWSPSVPLRQGARGGGSSAMLALFSGLGAPSVSSVNSALERRLGT